MEKPSKRSSVWLLPAVIFVVCWTLTTHGKYSVSGDEPHYLMVSQSLWVDGDLDVRNNYADGQSERFGAAGLAPGLHARETERGALLPVHDIGVPVALLPVYAVATAVSERASEPVLRRFRMTRGLFAYSLVSLFVIGLTTTAAMVTRTALVAEGASPGFASGIVFALWLAPPLLSNSFLVFPEPFALLATAWVVHVAARRKYPTLHQILLLAAGLGVLPWFHRKYAIFAALLLCAVVWRQWPATAFRKPSGIAAVLACFLVPQVALMWWTWHYWGTFGGPLMLDRAPFSAGAFRAGFLGLLVDRENGLLVWAPIYLFLPAAWGLAGRRDAVWLVPAAGLFLISAAHDQWWGGFSPAARFLVPLVPLFALIGVRALDSGLLRRISAALLVPQALISAYGWQYPRTLWPQGDGQNRVVGALLGWIGVTDGIFPSLRSASPEMRGALIAGAAVAAANLAIWMAATSHRKRLAGRDRA